MFRGPSDLKGHFASVQMGFVEAANYLNMPFVIYDGKQFWRNNDLSDLTVVASADPAFTTYENIEKWISQIDYQGRITILIFEGSLESVVEVANFARRQPNIRIYINLFYPEPGLSIPGTYDHFVGQITDCTITNRLRESINLLEKLPNIRLACDTDARSFLARSLGIRIDETWYGRSPIGKISLDLIDPEMDCKNTDRHINIFITVDIARFTYLQLWSCVSVIRFVSSLNQYQTNRLIWTFNFMPKEVSAKFRFLLLFLPKKTTKFVQNKVGLELYARRIHEAEVIWLPLSPYYASSSSGRVADAITLRKPILVPSGTYGHFEFSKWIPNWPTYRNQIECAQILLNLNNLLPLGSRLLRSQSRSISEYYSNVNQLKKVIGSEIVTHQPDTGQNVVNSESRFMFNGMSILNFARALLYSLSPTFQLRLIKLISFGIRRKISKAVKHF